MLQDKQDSAVSEFNARRVPRRHDHFAALLCDDPCDPGPVLLRWGWSSISAPVTVMKKGVPDPSRVLPREGGCCDSLSPPTIQSSHPVAQIATRYFQMGMVSGNSDLKG
jgi:hypothetical protein